MLERIAYIYKWATMGGVERVLLNRAEAFKRHKYPIRMDVMFLQDSNGKQGMLDYIEKRSLNSHINLVDELDYHLYDAVVSIDTPEAFDLIPHSTGNIVVECHTQYPSNREYLSRLPRNISLVLAPSKSFYDVLVKERPELYKKLNVLRNFVVSDDNAQSIDLPAWVKIPIVYVGRMDAHKNVIEIMNAASLFRDRYGDSLMLLFVGPRSSEIDIELELSRRSLTGRTVVLASIGFDKTTRLFQSLKERRAIFVSSSIGETFSLSAAEAISSGLPAVLSDIDAHRFLVDNHQEFLYPIGRPDILADRLKALIQSYDDIARTMPALAARYGTDAFLEDWNVFAARIGSTLSCH